MAEEVEDVVSKFRLKSHGTTYRRRSASNGEIGVRRYGEGMHVENYLTRQHDDAESEFMVEHEGEVFLRECLPMLTSRIM